MPDTAVTTDQLDGSNDCGELSDDAIAALAALLVDAAGDGDQRM